jgi:hypothetical protein
LNLAEAYTKAKRNRLAGWIIGFSSLMLMFMSLAKQLYALTQGSSFPLFLLVRNAVVWIYEKTSILSFLWRFAPTLSYPDIFVEMNWKFAALLCCFILGATLTDSGRNLLRRIHAAQQKAEEKRWEQSINGEPDRRNTLLIEIKAQPQDNWYTRPVGVITLAVIGGYLVNVLSKLTGL